MRHDAECGQNHDVDLGVTEEPQDVLIEHRVTASCRIEERRSEVPVRQQHGDRSGQNRQCQQDQPGRHEDRPREQRHLVQRHARCAHVQKGRDDVDRAQNGRRARDVDGEDGDIGRHARFGRGQRRIQHPPDAGPVLTVATGHQHRQDGQRSACHEQPERQVVEARKGHVRRTDVQGHEIIAETAEQGRDHHEEHHKDAVAGNQHVPKVTVRRTGFRGVRKQPRPFEAHELNTRLHKFEPHVDSE